MGFPRIATLVSLSPAVPTVRRAPARSHPMRAAVLTLAAAAFAAIFPACGGTRSPGEPAGGLGRRAPGFTLPSASGGRVALSDFTGKPVLLYFSMGPG
jgi:cytochrome oxidase Cu insertion factor (SCO1/SenC/PrrC family)